MKLRFNPYVIAFLVLFTIGLCVMDAEALSCMGGRGGCIASCQIQNCATGYCSPPGGDPRNQICVCSRCSPGKPGWP